MKYLILIKRSPIDYVAMAPDVPGCISWSRTLGGLLKKMQEDLTAHLKGKEIPEFHDLDWHMTQGEPNLRPNENSTIAWVEVPTKRRRKTQALKVPRSSKKETSEQNHSDCG